MMTSYFVVITVLPDASFGCLQYFDALNYESNGPYGAFEQYSLGLFGNTVICLAGWVS